MIKSLGVSGILVIGNKALILRRHKTDSEPGYWEFPKGKVEANETLEEAVIREFREETGLDAKIKNKIGSFIWGYSKDGEQHEVTESIFEMGLNSDSDINKIILTEHDEWRMVSKGRVTKLEPMVEDRRRRLLACLD